MKHMWVVVSRAAPLVSRILAAVGGGYALAAVASVAALALPLARPQAVLAGMLASFAIYAAAVVWVFAVRSAWWAWGGLAVVSLLLWVMAGLVPSWWGYA